MQDIRLERWAKALIEYSLYIKPGETVAIMATSEALPLVEAVYREVLHAGAHPVPVLNVESLDEILLREGNDAQLTWASPLQDAIAEKIDARLSILSSSNTKALSNVDPARAALRRQASRGAWQQVHQREQEGKFRWSLTLYPTVAYAQDSNMSLHEFAGIRL